MCPKLGEGGGGLFCPCHVHAHAWGHRQELAGLSEVCVQRSANCLAFCSPESELLWMRGKLIIVDIFQTSHIYI